MNVDTTLVFFRNFPLEALARYKRTCTQNNKMLSKVFNKNIHELRTLIEFGKEHRFVVGSILFSDEIKPDLKASLLAEKSIYDAFMYKIVKTLSTHIAHDAKPIDFSQPSALIVAAFKTQTIPSVARIFQDEKIFNLLEKFKFTENIANDFHDEMLKKNNMNPTILCDFAIRSLKAPHHEQSAVKFIDLAYTNLLKHMIISAGPHFIKANPLDVQQILNEMGNATTDDFLENPSLQLLVNAEAEIRVNFPGISAASIRQRLDKDMPTLFTPQNIFETTYEAYLQMFKELTKPEEIADAKQAIMEIPLDSLFEDEKIKNLLALEKIFNNHIKNHIPIADRIKNDIIKILEPC